MGREQRNSQMAPNTATRSRARPQRQSTSVRGVPRPSLQVVSEQDTGRARSWRLLSELRPGGDQPVDGRGSSWAVQEGVAERLKSWLGGALRRVAHDVRSVSRALLATHVVQERLAA